MYIKKIIIDGFKSYEQRTEVEFDPKYNIIVGENGLGKSSLLLAIQYVLQRKFVSLKKRQRLSLLNGRSRLKSASLEVIFDNSDKRLPINKKNVSVKRIISLRNDKFLLNDKEISETDISQILENAGFSKSNPYYIVEQGKISNFVFKSNMILELLHEITGTKFYEDHKNDFLITLNAIKNKKKKIQNILDNIGEKESFFKKNVKNLKEFENLGKQQRVIQLIEFDRNIKDNQSHLQKLNHKANTLSESHLKLTNDLERFQENIMISKTELTKLKKSYRIIQDKKKMLDLEQSKLLTDENEHCIKISDLKAEIKTTNVNCQEIDKKLEELKILIKEKEKNLQNLQSQCEQKLIDEEAIKAKLELEESHLKELCIKRERVSQFKTKDERDIWIRQELQQLEMQIADKNSDKFKIEQEIKDQKKECSNLEKKIEEFEMKLLLDQEKKLKDFTREHFDLKRKKDELLVLSNELFKENKNYTDQLTSLSDDITQLERRLKSIFGRSIVDGKNSVQKVLEIFKDNENMRTRLSEYCGLVIENINCNSDIFKAVEETAGKQLFYHIVKTREFGNKILKEMNRLQLSGEVTFLSIDCLKVPVLTHPINKESVPLISKLTYNIDVEKPIRRIFDKTLICSDLKAATILAKEYCFDCVTLQGDKFISKGLMKGGHFNNQNSSMKIQSEITSISIEISSLNVKLNGVKERMEKNNNDISTCISKQQNTEVKINKARKAISDIKFQINSMKKELNLKQTSIITKENNLKEYERQLHSMFNLQKSLNDELHQGMEENLSIHDQQQVENLNDSIDQLKKKFRKIYNERNKLEYLKSALEAELNHSLIYQNELVENKEKMSLENKQETLNLLHDELEQIETEILKNTDELKKLDKETNELQEQQKKEVLKMKKMQLDKEKLQQVVVEDAKKLEKITSKINVVEKTIQNSCQKMNELGVPNKNLYEKFSKMSHKELHKLLKHITERLQAYNKINKNALDQFHAYHNNKKLLYERKKKIDRAYIEVQKLIHVIELKKREAINFIFNQVSKYFTDIFKELVPPGNADLIKKPAHGTYNNDTETTYESKEERDCFIKIDIKARFTKSSEARDIRHLSGGQKSLLALVFIFAIQKCDPAPLYLFDEIDQALDFEYMKAVNKIILNRCQTAQFIVISLRPEFVQYANKFHRVTLQNNTSHIETITREEVITFLNKQKIV